MGARSSLERAVKEAFIMDEAHITGVASIEL